MSTYNTTEYYSRKLNQALNLFRCPSCHKYLEESERVKVTKQKHQCKTCVSNSKRQTRINWIRTIAEKVQNG